MVDYDTLTAIVREKVADELTPLVMGYMSGDCTMDDLCDCLMSTTCTLRHRFADWFGEEE